MMSLKHGYIEKEVVLTIKVPQDFDHEDERMLDDAFADILERQGWELVNSKEYRDVTKQPLLPVVLVDIIRERPEENERWVDGFWVSEGLAKSSEPLDPFRAAVEEFLETEDGLAAIYQTSKDFNWGDAMVYVPEEIWNKHGIYPEDPYKTLEERGIISHPYLSRMSITVHQDEVLIPASYYDKGDPRFVFDDEIMLDNDLTGEVEGYLFATDDLVTLLNDVVRSDAPNIDLGSMNNMNFYPTYNCISGNVVLNAAFWYLDGSEEKQHSCALPLTNEESSVLLSEMNRYSLKEYGRNLLSLVNEARQLEGRQPLVQAKPPLAEQINVATEKVSAPQKGPNTPDKARS